MTYHLQPKYESTTNAPTIGPKIGPANNVPAKLGIANPRSLAFQKSASAPPTIATVEEPKKPWRNLKIMTLWMFVATATGIWRMA